TAVFTNCTLTRATRDGLLVQSALCKNGLIFTQFLFRHSDKITRHVNSLLLRRKLVATLIPILFSAPVMQQVVLSYIGQCRRVSFPVAAPVD
ncbi:hypothetical protein L9F63_004928, partial [Diploptera punctata]